MPQAKHEFSFVMSHVHINSVKPEAFMRESLKSNQPASYGNFKRCKILKQIKQSFDSVSFIFPSFSRILCKQTVGTCQDSRSRLEGFIFFAIVLQYLGAIFQKMGFNILCSL